MERVPFLMLGLDLPPAPLYKDKDKKDIIPQVRQFRAPYCLSLGTEKHGSLPSNDLTALLLRTIKYFCVLGHRLARLKVCLRTLHSTM